MTVELDTRSSNGITVTLLFDPETDKVFIDLRDVRMNLWENFNVSHADAAEAFAHPFVYMPTLVTDCP